MLGLLDLANTLRRAAWVILALLELNLKGEKANPELHQAAQDAARELLDMARNLPANDAEADDDEAPRH